MDCDVFGNCEPYSIIQAYAEFSYQGKVKCCSAQYLPEMSEEDALEDLLVQMRRKFGPVVFSKSNVARRHFPLYVDV